MFKKQSNKYLKITGIVLITVMYVLLAHSVKYFIKSGTALPVTFKTIQGLMSLWFFSMLGVGLSDLSKKYNIKILADFPVLAFVSITSLILCLMFDFFVEAIANVDFLSLTTPLLAFAGISVANSLGELKQTSFKIIIVAMFVFIGTYAGSTIIAQIGLLLSGTI